MLQIGSNKSPELTVLPTALSKHNIGTAEGLNKLQVGTLGNS